MLGYVRKVAEDRRERVGLALAAPAFVFLLVFFVLPACMMLSTASGNPRLSS